MQKEEGNRNVRTLTIILECVHRERCVLTATVHLQCKSLEKGKRERDKRKMDDFKRFSYACGESSNCHGLHVTTATCCGGCYVAVDKLERLILRGVNTLKTE